MARAAVPGRLAAVRAWRPATLVDRRTETPTACTLVLQVEGGWGGHLAGQHVDVRLTADDGYQAVRSYSLAAPADCERVEITVARVDDGEVSPYLVDDVAAGDRLEIRGPLGGWFVWRRGDPAPVLLVAGGSGMVPLMAMIRTRGDDRMPPVRLLYSARSPDDVLYAEELAERAAAVDGPVVHYLFTRHPPPGSERPAGRITAADLSVGGWPPDVAPSCYVCGPTGFVESAALLLVELGHDPARIRTERFGPSGP